MKTHQRCFLPPGLGLALAFLLTLARAGSAAPFPVTNLTDSGPGSLRQAVLDANTAPGADEVVFATGLTGTITLTSGEIQIMDSLLIEGPGAAVLTVSGNDLSRIFYVASAVAAPIDVTLSGLTLTRGKVAEAAFGGAVYVLNENLTILRSVISNSKAGVLAGPSFGCGGNVAFHGFDGGTLRIVDSTLTGGEALGVVSSAGGNLCSIQGRFNLERSTLSGGTAAKGGGFYSEPILEGSTISFSTLSGNRAHTVGGGLAASGGTATLTIDSSTISGNTAGMLPDLDGFGGGIYLDRTTMRVVNSTISGNSAGGGGGIRLSELGFSVLILHLTTVLNNTAGQGGSILRGDAASAVQLDHSIVANGAPEDLDGSFVFAAFGADYSLIEAPGDSFVSGTNNLVGVDPALAPLADNGGPTLTHLPLPGSPVLDAGNPVIPSPPASDQRGFARISGPAIDLGSVEGQVGILEVPTLSQVGLFALSAFLLATGVWRLRRVRAESP